MEYLSLVEKLEKTYFWVFFSHLRFPTMIDFIYLFNSKYFLHYFLISFVIINGRFNKELDWLWLYLVYTLTFS